MKTTIFSLILAILVASLCYVAFENVQQSNLHIQQAIGALDNGLTQLKRETTDTKTSLAELQNKYLALKLEDNWKMTEASHLLRLAAIELQVSRNVSTSLHLLEAADNHLSAIQDPKLLPTRELIAKEKMALQAVKLPDLEKLWLQVGKLIEEVPSLPTRGIREESPAVKPTTELNIPQLSLNIPSLPDTTEANAEKILSQEPSAETVNPVEKSETPATPVPTWKKSLQSTWYELKDLIKIQHHTQSVEPILNQAEQALAQEKLLLTFEQLRWAILHCNATVYQASISEAKIWLERYFETQNSHTQQIQNTLEELSKIDLCPALPEIGQALQTLQTLQNKG